MKNKNNKKGFIGAIGDDLPSLVPIFFSLLIFFSVLSFVFITLSDRNEYLERYFESISLSKEVLGSSFFSGYEDFKSRIEKVNTTERYIIGLTYDPELLSGDEFDSSLFIESFFVDGEEEFILPYYDYYNPLDASYCTYADKSVCSNTQANVFFESSEFVNLPTGSKEIDVYSIFKNKKPFSYLYPVSLSTNNGVTTVYLYVLSW